jgi:PAS domain S-box-containing protein
MSARTSEATRHSLIASARLWLLALIPPLVVYLVQWAAWAETRLLFPAAVFVITCTLIAIFHGRLHRTNARLRQANQRIASLFEQAPDGIFVADLDGRYVDVNDAGCRLLGYDREEIIGKTIIDLIPPEDVARLERDKALLLAGGIAAGEWSLRRKDGTYVSAEVTAKILPDRRWQGFVRDITERKQLETALRSKSGDLERAQSVSRLGSWRFDAQRNEVRWSDEACRIFELPVGASTTYEGFLACVHPDDRQYVHLMWTAALHGAPYDIEHRLLIDGHVKWVREKAELEFDDRGVLVGGIGITQDITERKQLEQAVSHAQEELRLAHAVSSGILAVSADAIICIDGDQRIATFNEGAEKIFGHARHEVLGASLDILIPERFRAQHHTFVDRFAAGPDGARKMGEHRMTILGLRKDGREFPADAAISKLEVGGQKVLTATIRDITDQKRVEYEQTFLADIGLVLATSLDYDDTLTKIAKLAVRDVADICIVDLVIEQGNVHRIEAVCRDPARAWLGNAFTNLALERSKPTLTSAAISSGRSILIERVSDADIASFAQSEEHLQLIESAEIKSMMVVPLTVYARVIGAICLISSSPERCYGPSDLRLAEELGQRAAFAIENARLYSIAKRAISARDDILGIVAHDLRNPLNSIRLYSEILGDAEGRDERKAGEAIHRSVMRMNRLIQDLLDVTRLDSGRLIVEQSRVPTREVITSVIEAQRPLATSARLDLELELATDLPDAWADRDRLLQIFENLIGNALKFTRHGSITVGAAPHERELVFWVRDTGVGIPPAELPHLFDRFWQGRDKRQGAGLGLAIVKGIVEAHGGHIWVESTPDEGSCFYFTIPTAPTPEHWQSTATSQPP